MTLHKLYSVPAKIFTVSRGFELSTVCGFGSLSTLLAALCESQVDPEVCRVIRESDLLYMDSSVANYDRGSVSEAGLIVQTATVSFWKQVFVEEPFSLLWVHLRFGINGSYNREFLFRKKSWFSTQEHTSYKTAHEALKLSTVLGFGILATVPVASCGSQVDPEGRRVIRETEFLYIDSSYVANDEILKHIQTAHTQFPESSETGWRLARALYDVAQEAGVAAELKCAEEALAKDSDNSACNKEYSSVKLFVVIQVLVQRKNGDTYLIKKLWNRAAEITLGDATTRHLFGRWAFGAASIFWIVRQLAKATLATPSYCTWVDAPVEFPEVSSELC
jgi:hypothetical protein